MVKIEHETIEKVEIFAKSHFRRVPRVLKVKSHFWTYFSIFFFFFRPIFHYLLFRSRLPLRKFLAKKTKKLQKYLFVIIYFTY